MFQRSLIAAAAAVCSGGVVAYPTEAVFGLGCDPLNQSAVERLLAIKRRPWQKGVILIADSFDQFDSYIQPLNSTQQATLQASWPGAVTWIVPAGNRLPRWITGVHKTVAIRVPAHPLARQLCRLVGGPVVSTSANLSGQPAYRNALPLRYHLGQQLDGVVSGAVGGRAQPSTIRDLNSGNTLR